MLVRVSHEFAGPHWPDAVFQKRADLVFVQRIQSEHDQFTVRAEPSEGGGIILAQPLTSPARETKPRVTETLQTSPDGVKRSTPVAGCRSHLVEPVDKKRLPTPLGVASYLQLHEIPGAHRLAALRIGAAFHLERRGLPRSGLAEQHVCRRIAVVRQPTRLRGRGCVGLRGRARIKVHLVNPPGHPKRCHRSFSSQ